MVVSTVRRKLTYEDFLHFPEDGQRHEILDGVHVVTAAPTPRHQFVSFALSGFFFNYLEAHPVGKAACAPTGVNLAVHDVVQPDLWFLSNASLELVGPKVIEGAPDLAVEILSSGTRRIDSGKKRSRYEKLGVGEYWILDPERKIATIFRRQSRAVARFEPPILLSAEADDRLTSPLLPGLEISLRRVFAR
jgi:Uma2 family endonuclease